MIRSLFFVCIVMLAVVTNGAIYGAAKSAAKSATFISNLKADKKQVIVTYGTSLTANGAWVKHLQDELEKRYPGKAMVINSGGSGKWSDWGVKNVDKLVLQKNPDTVFIEFSMNDAVARFKGSVEIAKKNLETIMIGIRKQNPKCEIILMTMTPGDRHPEGHTSYRKDLAKHYDMYRAVAKQNKLLLIDHYPNWLALRRKDKQLYQKYVPDTIHPTPEGCAQVITPVILKAVGMKRLSE